MDGQDDSLSWKLIYALVHLLLVLLRHLRANQLFLHDLSHQLLVVALCRLEQLVQLRAINELVVDKSVLDVLQLLELAALLALRRLKRHFSRLVV